MIARENKDNMKSIINSIKKFVWSMLAVNGDISSKRCIAIGGMATLIYMAVYGIMTGNPVDHVVFGMLVSVVLGAAGITAWEKGKKLEYEEEKVPETELKSQP